MRVTTEKTVDALTCVEMSTTVDDTTLGDEGDEEVDDDWLVLELDGVTV